MAKKHLITIDKASDAERKRFIEILQASSEVVINYLAPVPDLKEFFDVDVDDILIHAEAHVKFSFRASALQKKEGQ